MLFLHPPPLAISTKIESKAPHESSLSQAQPFKWVRPLSTAPHRMTHCKIRLSFGSVHFKQQFLFMNVIWKYWKRWEYKVKYIGQFIFHLTHEGAEKSTPLLSAMTKLIPKEGKKSDIAISLTPFFTLYPLKIFKKLLIWRHMLTPRPQQCIYLLC